MKHRLESPKVFYKSVTQRNKHLLRYKINRSLNFDLNFSRKDHLHCSSSNLNLDNSCFSMHKPSRDLSRSAKIMRALSSDISLRHRNESIKKSLNFDPSPNKTNSSDESTSNDSAIHTSLHTPDKSLGLDRNSTDISTSSSVPTTSFESIDENQNRTPQQKRKATKVLSDTSDTKRSTDKSSSISLLRSNMKERIDSITRNAQTPDFQCLKQGNRLKISSCDIVASTPRNLLKEFNNGEEEDSPHTPENMMRLIPEGMSSIKKSHKKERSYCIGRKALEIGDPVKNIRLCTKRTTESLEADDIPTSSSSYVATMKESPKKIRNVKKALVYNLDNEFSDNESISDDAGQKVALRNIDSSDYEIYEENTQDVHDILPSTSLTSNYDEKENDFNLQKANSLGDVDLAELENKAKSCKTNLVVSQDLREDHTSPSQSSIYYLSKYKVPIGVKNYLKDCFEMKAANPTETQNISRVEQILGVAEYSDKTFKNKRPTTPENINSSRLLLSEYMSVKKSHKKDKKKKNISGISKYDLINNKHHKSFGLLLDKHELLKENDELINQSLVTKSTSYEILLKESFQKRKRFMNMSLQSDKLTLSESLFQRYQNIDNKFEIHTPIRKKKLSISGSLKDYICKSKMLPGNSNESMEITDTTDENGRLTPVNMSTAELLCNIDSIKKSHKKDKHHGNICKKRILENLSEYTKKAGDMNIADCTETSDDCTTPPLKLSPNDDGSYDETGACSNTFNENNRKSNEESVYDPQPSTSGKSSIVDNEEDTKKSKTLNTTPPNNLSTLKFMKLLHATSIKKSHKKERNLNAQSKYILMNHEYDLSDDGSIFDEEDKLAYVETSSPCQHNKN